MPKIMIEISKILNKGQEFQVEQIISRAINQINMTKLKVLRYDTPKMKFKELVVEGGR